MKKPGRPVAGRPRATIWDVARVAGVSAKTVSRVLNAEPGVAEATATRIHAAIATLGFRRNELARMLRTGGRGKTPGVGGGGAGIPPPASPGGAGARAARGAGHLGLTGSNN